MIDIVIGGAILPVQNNQKERDHARRQALKKKVVKDRRKNKKDRRKNVRSGVTVTLTTYRERRKGTDRRKTVA